MAGRPPRLLREYRLTVPPGTPSTSLGIRRLLNWERPLTCTSVPSRPFFSPGADKVGGLLRSLPAGVTSSFDPNIRPELIDRLLSVDVPAASIKVVDTIGSGDSAMDAIIEAVWRKGLDDLSAPALRRYTTFATDDLTVQAVGDAEVDVSVTVTNTGDRAGKHVVQVYVAGGAAPVRRPVRELRGFSKVSLEPGESATVALRLDRRAFAYWDVDLGRWVVPAGEYRVQVGADASTVLREQRITLPGDSIVRELTLDSTVGDWFGHPLVGPLLMQGMTANMSEEQAQQAAENPDQLKMVESMPMQHSSRSRKGLSPRMRSSR